MTEIGDEPERERTSPQEIFAAHLKDLQKGQSVDVEHLCLLHPAQAEDLKRLVTEWEHVSGVLEALEADDSSGDGPKRSAVGPSDTHLDLAEPPSSAKDASSPSGILRRLEARTPSTDRYQRKLEIARGGMGAILQVWDKDLRRNLAMKVVLEERKTNSGSKSSVGERLLGRFLDEAQITAQLDHPGIVPVHELGLDESGRVFFTMPLVRGRNLSQIMKLVRESDEGWTLTRAVGVLLKICEAMSYAHLKEVIHRDLKPANVMVGRFGEVYVMDWGLAKVMGKEDRHDLRIKRGDSVTKSIVRTDRAELQDASPLITMDGDIVGTPSYMSPEQARGKVEAMGPASDVYSVGCILYELLAGYMPYVPEGSKRNVYAVWSLLQDGPPDALEKISKSAPEELIAICNKAMSRKVADRYTDMSDMAEDLRAYLEGHVVRAHSTGAITEFRKWVQRNRALAGTAAAGLILSIGGLLLALRIQSRANEELSSQHGQLEALWEKYDLSKERIDSMEAQAQADIDRLKADTLRERQFAADLSRQVTEGQWELEAKQAEVDRAWIEARDQAYVANLTGAALSRKAGNYQELSRRLAACADSSRGWEWDHLALGETPELASIEGHCGAVTWGSNDQLLAAEHGGALHLHRASDGVLTLALEDQDPGIASLTTSTDAGILASGGFDGEVRIYEEESAAARVVTKATECSAVGLGIHEATGLLFWADGWRYRRALGTRLSRERAEINQIHVFSLEASSHVKSFGGGIWPYSDLAIHPDGRRVISASLGDDILVWNLETERIVSRLQAHSGAVRALALTPDGDHLLSGGEDGRVILWDLESARPLGEFEGHLGKVLDVAVSADGFLLASCSEDTTVRVWSMEAMEPLSVLRSHEGAVVSVDFSPDGRRVVSASPEDGIRVWDSLTSSPVALISPNDHRLTQLRLTKQGQQAQVSVPVWIMDLDPNDGLMPQIWGDQADLAPEGRRVAMRGRQRRLRRIHEVDLWDVSNGEHLVSLQGHSDTITALTWDRQGRWLATSSDDKTIRLWDTASNSRGPLIEEFKEPVQCMAFSPDGRVLAAGSSDGRVAMYTIETRVLTEMRGRHSGAVNSLSWRPDGYQLASGSEDFTIILWNTGSMELTAELRGHSGAVKCVSYDPQGYRLFSGSSDHTVRIWHSGSGASLLTLEGFERVVTSLGFERDGRRFITGERGQPPVIRVWDSAIQDAREMWWENHFAREARQLLLGYQREQKTPEQVLQELEDNQDIESPVQDIARRLMSRGAH